MRVRAAAATEPDEAFVRIWLKASEREKLQQLLKLCPDIVQLQRADLRQYGVTGPASTPKWEAQKGGAYQSSSSSKAAKQPQRQSSHCAAAAPRTAQASRRQSRAVQAEEEVKPVRPMPAGCHKQFGAQFASRV